MSRPAAIAIVAAVLALGATASAAIRPRLTITPSNPTVEQSVEIGFTAPRTLRRGETYSVDILGCSVVGRRVRPPRRAGERIRVRFRPTDQISGERRWCAGAAGVLVSHMRGDRRLRQVAFRTFRFRSAR